LATASCRLIKAEASLRTPKANTIPRCFAPAHARPLSSQRKSEENAVVAKGSKLPRFIPVNSYLFLVVLLLSRILECHSTGTVQMILIESMWHVKRPGILMVFTRERK
ncbi:MAG: hypothetical protein ACUVQG_09230, partial [Thermogutta sp.]